MPLCRAAGICELASGQLESRRSAPTPTQGRDVDSINFVSDRVLVTFDPENVPDRLPGVEVVRDLKAANAVVGAINDGKPVADKVLELLLVPGNCPPAVLGLVVECRALAVLPGDWKLGCS